VKEVSIILFIFIYIIQAKSQDKTDVMVFGDVKSELTKEHIPYATIMVKGTNMGTYADGTGHFKLVNLPVGKSIIIAKAIGYKAQEKEIFMERGEAVNLFFELEEDALELEQIVVTGTRIGHYIKDVPVRTEVISIKEIESKNAYNLYQALEGTPGIRVESQCQYCNFTMVRMQGLGAEHTQILINGQPIYSGLASVYGLQQLSTLDVDRIEVVKGAGSALYGSGAVAGAINIIPKEPSFEPIVTVDVQFGNHKTNNYGIFSSIRNEKGNIGLNIFAQKLFAAAIDETSEGISKDKVRKKDGISDRVESNLTNTGFGLFINNAFLKNDKLILRGKSILENRQGGTMNDDYYKNPLTDGTENITTDRYEAELSYNKKIKNDLELKFSLAYAAHKRDATNDSYLNDYLSTHHDSVPDLRNMRPYLANENLLTTTFTTGKRISTHNLLLGIQYFYDILKESGMYVVVDTGSSYWGESYRSVSNKLADEFGIFIQDEWAVIEQFVVVPGIRYDYHYSEEKYSADKEVFASKFFPKTKFERVSLNPRIAIKYGFSKTITLRANVGTGFRAPFGFSEDLHLCSGSPRIWKSSDLNPETSVSYNFSADYYGKKIRLSTNFFRTDLKNKIGFTEAASHAAALGYDYQWKNIDDAIVQGLELSLMANLVKNIDLAADFTYNQGEYKNMREDWLGTQFQKQSKHIPRFPTATGNIKFEYSPKSWNFVILGNYQGKMYIDYYKDGSEPAKIKETDPLIIFNARVSKKTNAFKLYVGVNNIFNYIQDEKHLDDPAFIYAPVYGTILYGGVTIDIKYW
jgi:outer membrane receptor for ferrienterochelin and colicins